MSAPTPSDIRGGAAASAAPVVLTAGFDLFPDIKLAFGAKPGGGGGAAVCGDAPAVSNASELGGVSGGGDGIGATSRLAIPPAGGGVVDDGTGDAASVCFGGAREVATAGFDDAAVLRSAAAVAAAAVGWPSWMVEARFSADSNDSTVSLDRFGRRTTFDAAAAATVAADGSTSFSPASAASAALRTVLHDTGKKSCLCAP